MATIFKPSSEKEYFTPFGPMMGYFKMPDNLVEQLNHLMIDGIENQRLKDHSNNLVGKVQEELLFDKPLIDLVGAALGQSLIEYHIRAIMRGSFGNYDHTKKQFALDIASGWFVRQFENQYNPLHIHTGCHISCVGYLQLPNGIEREWEDDYSDHHPSHGHLQFAHGTDTHYSVSNFMIKPSVGDFWIFPSHMFHCVYPYKTQGERRSFSLNVSVQESDA